MRLHFKSFGNGKPLVILHGLFGSLNNWQTMGRRLGENFEVFTVDQRNHGHSPHSPVMNYREMATDLVEFFDEHRLVAAHVLGHSMGGKTAMQFALSYPARTRSLIVVDIAPRAYAESHDPILDALLGIPLAEFSSREEVDKALAVKIENQAVRAFLLTNLRRDEAGRFEWKMNLPVLKEHYQDLVAAVSTDQSYAGPTLFLKGGKSNYLTTGDEPLMRRLFPAYVTFTIEAAGHWVHSEAPDALFAAVVRFLADNEND